MYYNYFYNVLQLLFVVVFFVVVNVVVVVVVVVNVVVVVIVEQLTSAVGPKSALTTQCPRVFCHWSFRPPCFPM